MLLDCETTGGRASSHRVTEIGLVIVENGEVVDTWSSLINPERSIPQGITRLTGITDEMVAKAPLFTDIAGDLLSKLQGKVFVAHNARFDYSFIKTEFRRAGIAYQTKPLCSVRLSRKLFPQCKRHGLDQLIARFSIPMADRHRGLDDALAIWHFFRHCSERFEVDRIELECNALIKRASTPPNLDPSEIEKLPDLPGVYRFYDETGILLYVGKSVSLRTRVMSHFSGDHSNAKDLEINTRISHIDFDRTPSDFGAQLLESAEIKKLAPVYNRRLRRHKKLFHLVIGDNSDGYRTARIDSLNVVEQLSVLDLGAGLYRSRAQAKSALEALANEFLLCHQLIGLERPTRSGCFRRQLKRCLGACCCAESIESYNGRFDAAFKSLVVPPWPFRGPVLIVECCREDTSFRCNHVVDNWTYLGRVSDEQELADKGYAPVNDRSDRHHFDKSIERGNNATSGEMTGLASEMFDVDTYFILVRFLGGGRSRSLPNVKILELKCTTQDSQS